MEKRNTNTSTHLHYNKMSKMMVYELGNEHVTLCGDHVLGDGGEVPEFT